MANLTQLKTLEGLDGVLLVDKPEGIAFATVIKAVKRKFGLVKVGHGGSLDAMASGLFVVLIGDANKFADRIMGADRVWSGSLAFGSTTDTGDRHGRPIAFPERVMRVEEAKGDLFQTEPRYSTIRKEGSATYEIADTGDHSPFLTHVYRFEVEKPKEAVERMSASTFLLSCARGVIVRALAQDLGATLMTLRREKIGSLDVRNAIPFAKILEMETADFPAHVIPFLKVWE